MAKQKTAFVCNDCGSDYVKWQGQCSDCEAWNTLTEIKLGPQKGSGRAGAGASPQVGGKRAGFAGTLDSARVLQDIDLADSPRFSSGAEEFDRVLGGGLVPGSGILLGGNPGAGKSTLLLQTMCHLARTMEALYVTGEESLQQVAMRARRLQLPTDKLQLMSETNVEAIVAAAEALKPKVLVVDSIQVVHTEEITSAPGSVSQVRECAAYLIRYAKQTGMVLLLVGHVTKDGSLAGPKVLEHMIDCSILLEGSDDARFRTLRGQKNRFGAVNELGIFAMTEQGMREVKNPSAIFLDRASEPASGSAVMVVWEGTRPLLVEIQALVDDSQLGNPRRVAVGLEQNRLAMLLAVLHRHGGLQVGDQDVFANVVGGVKVLETSADLALLLAIVSSYRDKILPRELVMFGEVGLSGEIRPVPNGQERLLEAAKHGFKRAIVPKGNAPKGKIRGMQVTAVSKLSEALDALE
jgi:DNA repair protein RadA/Sms|tara:strand:- start:7967 stop:9361 length:1395 start_codon:yes stop_codon:yes gene_type:complete